MSNICAMRYVRLYAFGESDNLYAEDGLRLCSAQVEKPCTPCHVLGFIGLPALPAWEPGTLM